jgi:ankyrin repeat protein
MEGGEAGAQERVEGLAGVFAVAARSAGPGSPDSPGGGPWFSRADTDGVIAPLEPLDALWLALAVEGTPQDIGRFVAIQGTPAERGRPEPRDVSGRDALSAAAAAGRADNVATLLAWGDPSSLDSMGRQALSLAASSGSARAVETLMGRSDPLAAGACGFTALFWAVLDKRLECCRLLAAVEGAAASRDKLGRTPLMVAANRGVLWAVEMLIPLSDESAVDGSGRNALMLAAGEGHRECAFALATVASISAVDLLGQSAAERSKAAWGLELEARAWARFDREALSGTARKARAANGPRRV